MRPNCLPPDSRRDRLEAFLVRWFPSLGCRVGDQSERLKACVELYELLAAEREACAAIVDDWDENRDGPYSRIADAIRAGEER